MENQVVWLTWECPLLSLPASTSVRFAWGVSCGCIYVCSPWLPCAHLPPLLWLQETLPWSGTRGVGQRGVCFQFQGEALSDQHRKQGICEWMSRAITVGHGVNYLTVWRIPACIRCHITTLEHTICFGIKWVMMTTGWLCPFKLLMTCSLRSHRNGMV